MTTRNPEKNSRKEKSKWSAEKKLANNLQKRERRASNKRGPFPYHVRSKAWKENEY